MYKKHFCHRVLCIKQTRYLAARKLLQVHLVSRMELTVQNCHHSLAKVPLEPTKFTSLLAIMLSVYRLRHVHNDD